MTDGPTVGRASPQVPTPEKTLLVVVWLAVMAVSVWSAIEIVKTARKSREIQDLYASWIKGEIERDPLHDVPFSEPPKKDGDKTDKDDDAGK